MQKWEQFLADALQGKLGDELQRSLQQMPSGDPINVVIRRAVQYGGLTAKEITGIVDGPQELPEEPTS